MLEKIIHLFNPDKIIPKFWSFVISCMGGICIFIVIFLGKKTLVFFMNYFILKKTEINFVSTIYFNANGRNGKNKTTTDLTEVGTDGMSWN